VTLVTIVPTYSTVECIAYNGRFEEKSVLANIAVFFSSATKVSIVR
jgi:hypothetical protein